MRQLENQRYGAEVAIEVEGRRNTAGVPSDHVQG